jgi:hypothetical protein
MQQANLGTVLFCSRLLCRKLQQVSGANPTIVIYNASVVKIYNTTNSLVRFENKNILFLILKKCSSLQQRWRCSCKF